jgi:hypothetical protein
MWRSPQGEATRAIPTREAGAPASPPPDDHARSAWIRVMSAKPELDEEEAAHLWDTDIPLIPKGVFAEGFHARDAELTQMRSALEEKDRAISAIGDDLRRTGQRIEALVAELEEKSSRVEALEADLQKARGLARAVAALANAAGDESVALDPDRMTQIAFSVLTDLSLAVSGEKERRYPSRPVYIRAAAVFKKLYDEGETREFVTLYQDLSSLLREMEPYMFAAQQASLEAEPPDGGKEAGVERS